MPRPILTQRCTYNYDAGGYIILPIDGWTTGSPHFVITPSAYVPADPEHPGFYELIHLHTGYAMGKPYDGSVYSLNDLAALAAELELRCSDWRSVRGKKDLRPPEARDVQYALDRFRLEHGDPAIYGLI